MTSAETLITVKKGSRPQMAAKVIAGNNGHYGGIEALDEVPAPGTRVTIDLGYGETVEGEVYANLSIPSGGNPVARLRSISTHFSVRTVATETRSNKYGDVWEQPMYFMCVDYRWAEGMKVYEGDSSWEEAYALLPEWARDNVAGSRS